jgi:hypothetical protein
MALFKPDEKPLESSTVAAVAEWRSYRQARVTSKPRGLTVGGIIVQSSLLSAVPFGIFLLVLLIEVHAAGMLIQQVDLVDTFPRYFANLAPAEG